jgi:hypothetical protein
MSEDLEHLFVDKKKLAIEIAEDAEDILRIDAADCSPILSIPLDDLKDWARIVLELSTAYMCFIAGRIDSEYVSRELLAQRCGINENALRARLSELRKSRLIETAESGETITVHGLFNFMQFLKDIRRDLESEDE